MLYAAMRTLLVDEGPLENLFSSRLPPEQTAAVDAACILQGGSGAERYLGSEPVVDGPPGVTHDGGVLWFKTAVQFQVRGEDPEDSGPAAQAADWIRDLLIQYAGEPIVRAGEIVRCDITRAPSYFGQDEQERVILAVGFEVWHRPA